MAAGRAPVEGLGRLVAPRLVELLGGDDVTTEDLADSEELMRGIAAYVDKNVAREREAGYVEHGPCIVRELAQAAGRQADGGTLVQQLLAVSFEVLAALDPHALIVQIAELKDLARRAGMRRVLLEREWAKAALLLQECHDRALTEPLLQLPGLLEAWAQLVRTFLAQRRADRASWRSTSTRQHCRAEDPVVSQQRRTQQNHGPPRARVLCRHRPIHRNAPPAPDRQPRPQTPSSQSLAGAPRSTHGGLVTE